MNIALVHQRWSRRGGAENYMTRLAHALHERGHHIGLFVHFRDIPVPPGMVLHHVPLLRFPLWLRLYSFALFSNLVLRKCDYDLSLGFGKVWGLDLVRPSGGCHRAYEERIIKAVADYQPVKRPFLSLGYTLSPFQAMNRFIEDKMFDEKNHIIAVSGLVKDDILRYYPRDTGSISIIHNGYDPAVLDPHQRHSARQKLRDMLHLSDKTFVLLQIATNPLLKGFAHLLKVVGQVRAAGPSERGPVLLLVGPSKNRSLQRLVARSGLEDCLRIVPFTSDISLFYRGADLLVHPTMYDAFANVCLEAMSYALPVLTSSLNGGAEIIAHGQNGWVIEKPWNHKDFAELTREIMARPDLEALGLRGYELLKKYTFQHNVDCVDRLLQHLLVQKRAAQANITVR